MSDDIKTAHRELTGKVMGKAGVSGTAIGQHDGKPCLKVYVSDDKASKAVPSRIGGFRVVIERTGGFRRL